MPQSKLAGTAGRWTVLLVDDDPSILALTSLVIGRETLDGVGVEILKASSAAEARRLMTARTDIAVAVIDVIMETESAGLDLVQWLAESPAHAATRRVLHTGQPGEGREEQVSRAADIHDYWAKGTLRAPELRRRLLFQLRQYRDLARAASPSPTVLRCLAYRSRYVGADILADTERIAARSRERNAELGVTGALLAYDGRFFQVIEGTHDAVAATFARITSDPRHTDLRMLVDRPASRRMLPQWSMRFVRPAREQEGAGSEFETVLDAYARDFRFEPEDALELIEAIGALPKTAEEAP